MIINNITIKNFRGFKERYFEFDPHINVVLGDNTTGKTTLLHAVQIALGAFFKALKIVPRLSAFSRNFKKTDVPMFMNDASKSFLQYDSKPSIVTNADFYFLSYNINEKKIIDGGHYNIDWWRNYNSNSKKDTELLNDVVVSKIEDLRLEADNSGENSIFPLFLAFGSNRLEHNNYLAPQKTKSFYLKMENAYRNALDDRTIDFISVSNWIYNFDFSMKKGMEFENTDIAFFNALKDAIPAIKDIHVDNKNGVFSAQIQMSKDPESHWLTYDSMSDGFKSMINIVSDIAYRCIMLNGFLGENAVKETPGVVMIDEVDLFLHPHWQQHVLADLQKAFPKIQFIVTTHSPFIVQSVESKNVITLDVNPYIKTDPKNRGIEEIAASEMGMSGELKSTKYRRQLELAEKYFNLINEGKTGKEKIEKVRKELNDLEFQFELFNDPAYEAYLKFKRSALCDQSKDIK